MATLRVPGPPRRVTGRRGRAAWLTVLGALFAMLSVVFVAAVFIAACSSTETAGESGEAPTPPPALDESPAPTAAATPTPTAAATPTPTAVPPPNIVMILMDDLRADQMEFMPNTAQWFAANGTVFTDSIVSFAECCPSRATALSGQYAHNHGVLSGDLPSGGVTRFDPTTALPVWLDDSGYETMLVGKYLNGYGDHAPPDVPPGWDQWFGLIDPSTLYWHEFEVFDNGTRQAFSVDDHRTVTLGARAVADIEQAAEGEDPFLLWFAPVAPHIGFTDRAGAVGGTGVFGVNGRPSQLRDTAGWFPPPSTQGLLDDYRWEAPATWGGPDRAGKPAAIERAQDLADAEIDAVRDDYRRMGESILAVDLVVADILDALERTGELDNTAIIFTSDNGFYLGEHRLVYVKYWPYEEGIRVPLMVSGPGFDVAEVTSPAANIDLAATIASLAGVTPMVAQDGIPLQELAAADGELAGRPLLLESGPTFGRSTYSGVRVDGLKYIEHRNGHRELYDLIEDPFETTNRWGDASWAEVGRELVLLNGALRSCVGASCQEPEPSDDLPPVPVVDPWEEMVPGELFRLHAGGSHDPDGGPVTYLWEQVDGPHVPVLGVTTPNLRGLGADEPVTIRLTVTDDEGHSTATVVAL